MERTTKISIDYICTLINIYIYLYLSISLIITYIYIYISYKQKQVPSRMQNRRISCPQIDRKIEKEGEYNDIHILSIYLCPLLLLSAVPLRQCTSTFRLTSISLSTSLFMLYFQLNYRSKARKIPIIIVGQNQQKSISNIQKQFK